MNHSGPIFCGMEDSEGLGIVHADQNENGGTQYGGPITIETLNGEIIDKK